MEAADHRCRLATLPRLDKDPTTNRKILDQLPGMMWHMPVSRATPRRYSHATHTWV